MRLHKHRCPSWGRVLASAACMLAGDPEVSPCILEPNISKLKWALDVGTEGLKPTQLRCASANTSYSRHWFRKNLGTVAGACRADATCWSLGMKGFSPVSISNRIHAKDHMSARQPLTMTPSSSSSAPSNCSFRERSTSGDA